LKLYRAFLAILLAAGATRAGELTCTVDFDPSGIREESVLGMTFLEMPGTVLRGMPGTPLLPAKAVVLVLPAGAVDVSIEARPSDPVPVGNAGVIAPARVLRPLDRTGDDDSRSMSELVYGSRDPWPADVVIGTHTGRLCGFTVASCIVQPWRYTPLTGELELYTSVDVRVSWEPGHTAPISGNQAAGARWRLEHLVDNPEDLEAFSPPVRGGTQGDVEHLIVCDSAFTDEFQPLADFHNGEGLTCSVLTSQEAVSGWPGADDPERLRNCLRDYWENRGTVSVLLAGDDTVLPTRFIYTECEMVLPEYAPADLYFADLDGTWDGNGDGEYGQPDDDLDLYADLLVGRAPFSVSEDAQTFVGKTLMYMTDPPGGPWSREAVLCGAVLFEEQGYIAAKGCDLMADAMPASWEIIKAYEVLYGSDIDTHVQYITDGSGWTHYAGHGNERGVYWHYQSKGMMTTWMADTLWNGDMTGVHSSIACHPGAYQEEDECLAEVLLNRPDRGAVAVLFNTSYGWEGFWPDIGSSERMCVYVVQEVFENEAPSLGLAFASAKDREIPMLHGGYDRVLQSLLAWTAFHDPPLRVLGVPAVEPVPPPPIVMSAPWPNPATRDVPIAFQVTFGQSPVQVSVHDLGGRLLWCSEAETGVRMTWDGCDPSGNRVPAGVYIISARRNTAFTSRLVTVLD
jgi:hypothetical protein